MGKETNQPKSVRPDDKSIRPIADRSDAVVLARQERAAQQRSKDTFVQALADDVALGKSLGESTPREATAAPSTAEVPLRPLHNSTDHKWFSYYWVLCTQFGAECYRTWRRELLVSLILSIITYAITRSEDAAAWKNFTVAVIATGLTLGAFALWHLIRIPWLVHQHTIGIRESSQGMGFGILGMTVLCGMLAGSYFLSNFALGIRGVPLIVKTQAPPPPAMQASILPPQLASEARLVITDGRGQLNGRVIYWDKDGNAGLQNNLELTNLGAAPASYYSVRMYFSTSVNLTSQILNAWQVLNDSNPRFPIQAWTGGNNQISPEETWTLPVFSLRREGNGDKPVSVKVLIYYGAPKPTQVFFTIENAKPMALTR